MPGRLSFRKTFHALENAIKISQQKHGHIIGNISNLETPGYRAKDIDFKTALARAVGSDREIQLVRTHPKHMGFRVDSPHGIEAVEQQGEWNGYNWVSIDKEMTKLIENNLMYRTAIETLMRKIAILRDVVREGGR